VAVIDLLIHELAHDLSGDHLSSEFHDALSLLGAKLTNFALLDPELFAQFGAKTASSLAANWQGLMTYRVRLTVKTEDGKAHEILTNFAGCASPEEAEAKARRIYGDKIKVKKVEPVKDKK
jgi:hypothetical protein